MGGSLGSIKEPVVTATEAEEAHVDAADQETYMTNISSYVSNWIPRTKLTDWYQCKQGRKAGDYLSSNTQTWNQSGRHTDAPTRSTLNWRDAHGDTPLVKAIRQNDVDVVCELIRQGEADVNFPALYQHSVYRWNEITPLVSAVTIGNCACVETLCEAGAQVNVADHEGLTPLHHAAIFGDVRTVETLILYGAKLEPLTSASTPFHLACSHGNETVVDFFLSKGVDVNRVNEDGHSGLHLAIQNKHSSVALSLLHQGADPHRSDTLGRTPLMLACLSGIEQVARSLVALKAGVNDTDYQGNTPLMFSIQPGKLSVLTRLIKFGNGGTSVGAHLAEHRNTLETSVSIMESLLGANCDVEYSANQNETALYHCLKFENMAGVLTLLKHGAFWNDQCDKILSNQMMASNRLPVFLKGQCVSLQDVLRTLIPPKQSSYLRQTRSIENQKEPFSLQHSCRQTIRQALLCNRRCDCSILPLLNTLPLPVSLVQYLQYNDILL